MDAVAFAVPPETQAELALVAVNAGKHLLLDKPVALTVAAANALRDAATAAGVASVVFFTDRFADESRAWFREVGDRRLARRLAAVVRARCRSRATRSVPRRGGGRAGPSGTSARMPCPR